ncbi:MAG: hypothetical protein ACRDHL_09575 [Candidatus Promineifilaceae bacterium]
MRAVFSAEVLERLPAADKLIVRLDKWIAGRQESPAGDKRSAEAHAHDYWRLVARLEGRRITLAQEAADGRPLWLRLETLTGEHNFFYRLDPAGRPGRDESGGAETESSSPAGDV